MLMRGRLARSPISRTTLFTAVAVCGLALAATAGAVRPGALTLQGRVMSGGAGLPGYSVSLYAGFVDREPHWLPLGSAKSDDAGNFSIDYSVAGGLSGSEPLLFVEATRGRAMLASAISTGPSTIPVQVVVNERTTVATGNAFAQFVDGRRIVGNRYGMANAVHMAANLANPETGAVGSALATVPNGTKTSTLATFQLANERGRELHR